MPPMDAPSAFPIAPAPFSGKSRRAEAGACFDWLRQAWAMFAANPGVWVSMALLLIVFYLALSIVPFLGSFAANLLLPAFSAGVLAMCRHQAQGEEASLNHLLEGFQGTAASGLVVVGALYGAALLLIVGVAFMVAGGGVVGGLVMGRPAGLGVAFGGLMVSLLLILVLATPLIMAMFFAPALVFFHGMPPVAAMKASFHACALNWLSLSVYGLLLSVLMFFALLPVGLGLLVLIPLLYGTLYAAYRDIFPAS